MARITQTFTVNDVGNMEPVITTRPCVKVRIWENGGLGTTDFHVAAPLPTSPQLTKPSGSIAEFDAPRGIQFSAGQTVGYVETVSGTVTFCQEEE